MPLLRTIGRWGLTALIINMLIGSGIFGIPGELNRMLGRASPLAFVFAGLGMGVMAACFAEVASQFAGAGGAYLYTRTAFGRFVGMQIAWFSWLAPLAAGAAAANLFTAYLGALWPAAAGGLPRALVLLAIIGALAAANYLGVRSGVGLSSVFTLAKLSALGLLIVAGLVRAPGALLAFRPQQLAATSPAGWAGALLFLAFAYAGFDTCLLPSGEVKQPRRDIPFALGAAMLACIVIYTLLQFVVLGTLGVSTGERPLAQAASVLLGPPGALFITLAAMVSTYGFVAAVMLSAPRLTFALSAEGDFPAVLGRIHPRFRTPHVSIVVFGVALAVVAVSGTFRWALLLASGAVIVIYGTVCAALIRLRRLQPQADALRLPLGNVFAVVGAALAVVLLLQLSAREALVLLGAAVLAAGNWLWAVRRRGASSTAASE